MKLNLVKKRLIDLSVAVEAIRNISGVPSVSVGILYQGETFYRENFGFIDNDKQQSPTSDTMYGIGSLTKSLVAAGLAKLFNGSTEYNWASPVKQIVPEFRVRNSHLEEMISTVDCLSHSTGLWGGMSIALQGDQEFLIPPDQLFNAVASLEQAAPLRRRWLYNNWGYSLAGKIMEKISKKPWHEYLTEAILEPLELLHTTTRPITINDTTFAAAHAALQNATAVKLPKAFPFEDSIFGAAGGLYSTVNDLLKYAKAVLDAERDPDSSPVLRDMRTILSNQIPLDYPSHDSRHYGMGWIRTQLPGIVGLQGDNAELLDLEELPVLGSGARPMMAYYHQGAALGYYSSIFLFPESKSAIITLTNSIPLNDAADWIGQAYASALFDFPNSADYVDLAYTSRRRKVERMAALKTKLQNIRRMGPELTKSLKAFVGTYFNEQGNFQIDISEHDNENDCLRMVFQEKEAQVYDLRHLQGDVFEWGLEHDESAQRARFAEWDPLYFQVFFAFGNSGQASSFTWAKQRVGLPNGIKMRRNGTQVHPTSLDDTYAQHHLGGGGAA